MEEKIRKNNSFVVLDLETLGFYGPAKGGRIIEVGAIKIVDGKGVQKFSQLIDPKKPIPKKIQKITGITNEMVRGKPETYMVLRKLHEFIEGSAVVAHNAPFDWSRFLLVFFKQMGLDTSHDIIDTLKLSKKYLKNEDNEYKLGYLCNMLDIELLDAHRAYDDALATAHLFMHIKKKYIDSVEQTCMIGG